MPRGGGYGGGRSSSLIGQKCKLADGKQSSDWTIIQDGNSACDLTRIQDSEWKSSHLIGQISRSEKFHFGGSSGGEMPHFMLFSLATR